MPRVCLSVVGLYFGTTGTPDLNAPDAFSRSKFNNAPVVDVPISASVKDIADAISRKVMAGEVPGCEFFRLDVTDRGFIRSIEAKYNQDPKQGRRRGLYRFVDTQRSDDKTNPKLAWQYYVLAGSTLSQKEANGFSRNALQPLRELEDGDLIILRCVLIATAPVDYNANVGSSLELLS